MRGVTPPTDAQAQQTVAEAGGTAFSTEAATAALALAATQQTTAQNTVNEAKKQSAVAFVAKIQQYKAAADKSAAESGKVDKRLELIKSTNETANAQQKQQLAAAAQVGAAKAAALAKINVVQPKPATNRAFSAPGVVPLALASTGGPANRAIGAPTPAATGAGLQGGTPQPAVQFQPKPLMNLSPAVRAAFARELAADEAKAKAPTPAAGAPGARAVGAPIPQQVATARAASVQALAGSPAVKSLPAGVTAQSVLGAEQQTTDPFEKAALLKSANRVSGRQSQIPGAPDSVQTRPVTPDRAPLVANVNNDYLNNLQLLRQIPR
jgi:hypothetical protein